MIISAVVYFITISTLATLAAWSADEGLRRLGLPTRWVWLSSMLAGPLLLFGPFFAPIGSGSGEGAALAGLTVIQLPELLITPGAGLGLEAWVETLFGVGWGVVTLAMVVVLVRTHRGLRDERGGWEPTEVDGRDVFLSVDRGPAVAGVLRPWIVLPRWSLALPESELRLIVLHEEEHLRARDTWLLAAALALLVATPWNPIAWLQLRRLRTAMEIDCDRRVLRRAPDRARYGASLLEVAARASGHSLGLAAFTEKPHSLQKRIVAMTPRKSPWNPVRALLFLVLAPFIGLQACGVDSPVTVDESGIETLDAVQVAEVDIRAEPTFTPFTMAPSITNRDEVVATMAREYPPLLRDAGIGGTVTMYFFINAEGIVEQVRINESSGHEALDQAAMNVAGAYEFTPALDRDEKVPVWVSFPVTFQPS